MCAEWEMYFGGKAKMSFVGQQRQNRRAVDIRSLINEKRKRGREGGREGKGENKQNKRR